MLRCGSRLALPVLALSLLVLSGCSRRAAVEGAVNFAGAPVDGGRIIFNPTEEGGKVPPVSADIVGGKYSLPAASGPVPGQYRVEITWKKKTGKQIDTPGDPGVKMDETVEAIPPTYNGAKTTLTADVKSGANKIDFDLK